MEDEQIASSPSASKTFSEYLDELAAHYMAIGVPCDEFWRGDYTRLSSYRAADKLRQERADMEAHLQGAYFYDALCMAAPIFNPYAKSGTKPIPYHERPYTQMMAGSGADAHAPERQSEIAATNASAKFASFAAVWNKKFEAEGSGRDGDANRPAGNRDTSEREES